MQKLEILKKIARQAGAEVMKFYDLEYDENMQKEEFPVTKADIASHNKIMAELKLHFPDIKVLSEEAKENQDYLGEDKFFIVDPLDGTKDFLHKTGDFSIMIALAEKNKPVIGIVYLPVKDVLYFASKGNGAFKEVGGQVKKIKVSGEADFSKMKLLVSRFHVREQEIKLKDVLGLADFEKRGSVAKMCAVAEGSAHLYVSTATTTGEWDTAAASVVLVEAGGKVTDMDGGDLTFGKKEPYNNKGFVASNGVDHERILQGLGKVS